jgi:hypothetical protein
MVHKPPGTPVQINVLGGCIPRVQFSGSDELCHFDPTMVGGVCEPMV